MIARYAKCSTLLRHNYIPKKMLYGKIRTGMKDNTVCQTKLENFRPVVRSALLLKVFQFMLLPLSTNNFKLCDQQLEYRKQSICRYTITIMKKKYYAI